MPILRALQEMEAEASGAGKPWWGISIGQIAERMGKSINEIGPQLDSLEYDGYVSVKSKHTHQRPSQPAHGRQTATRGPEGVGGMACRPDDGASERIGSGVGRGKCSSNEQRG